MPKQVLKFYELTGWVTVTIYTEQEMADTLGMERGQLREAIGRGELSYHLHPMADTADEGYEFNQASYFNNIARQRCLQSGGHHFVFDHYYDSRLGKAVYKCLNCPAESTTERKGQ